MIIYCMNLTREDRERVITANLQDFSAEALAQVWEILQKDLDVEMRED